MSYEGSWKIDDLLTFTAVTKRVDTGAATDADSAPAYRVYEDETSTPILTGTMALLDSGNTAGFYSEQITLSAANGFEKGKSYNIYIQATVNSVVGATKRNFQIEAEVDANRLNWANVDNPTTTVGLSGTTVKDATDVNTDTDTLLSRLGTPSDLGNGASVAGNLVTIEGQTDDIGAAGAGLTDLGGMSTTMKGQVQTEAEDALVAHRVDELLNADSDIDGAAPPTVGSVFHELMSKTAGSFTFDQTTDSNEALRDNLATAASIAALNNLSAAQVNAEADTALADVGLTTTITGRIDATVSTRASQTSVDDLPTNAELATSQAAADDATLAAIAALNNVSAADVLTQINSALTTAVADSVPADGSRPSIAQAAYMVVQILTEMAISGTTMTVKKPDGSTTLLTCTLNDATTPTSVTRSG